MHGTAPNDVQGKKRRMDWDPLDLNSSTEIGSSDPKSPHLVCGKDRDRRKNTNGGECRFTYGEDMHVLCVYTCCIVLFECILCFFFTIKLFNIYDQPNVVGWRDSVDWF